MTNFILQRKLGKIDLILGASLILLINIFEYFESYQSLNLLRNLLFVNLGGIFTFYLYVKILPLWTKNTIIEIDQHGIKKNSFHGLSCEIKWNEISSVIQTNGMLYTILIINGPTPKRILADNAMENFVLLKSLLESKGFLIEK